jgi:pyroglutamyl-peptidase
MTTILLTGFEAFGNTPINPAECVVRELDGTTIGGARVCGRVVPNVFFRCIEVVRDAIEETKPDAVIMLGEYGGRAMITVEQISQNLNDATRYSLVDNEGCAPQDLETVPGGPVAYFATVPIRAMVRQMRDAGIPADISDTPGTFCCNHLMFGILHHLATSASNTRAGWIHLPHLPEVAAKEENLGAPSMSVATSVAGVKAGITAVLGHREDIFEPILSRFQI